jgi:hypothetical protein
MNSQNKIIMVLNKLHMWSTAHRWALKKNQFNISNSNNLDILMKHGSKIVSTTNNTKFWCLKQ